jgi:hypothetical protein
MEKAFTIITKIAVFTSPIWWVAMILVSITGFTIGLIKTAQRRWILKRVLKRATF